MEQRLDSVSEGEEPWKDLCRDTWDSYKETYKSLKGGSSTTAPAAVRERLFAGGIKAVQSKKGPLLLKEAPNKDDTVFYGWPGSCSFHDITEEDVAAFIASKAVTSFGEYNGHPMVKKSGPFGSYVSCNGVNVPFANDDTEDTIRTKLGAKANAAVHTLGPFEFRTGPYGMFMFKKDLVGKSRKFVNIPAGVDPKTLTQEAAIKIYQTGLQQKAKGSAYKKKNVP
jgi:hypothetical protein